jgi:ferric iron reductase protein FhuF
VDVTTAAEALRAAAALGPYFAVDTAADGPRWLALDRLASEPELLRERVATARSVLAERCGRSPEAIDERAAASVHFLGLAARLISPAFGAAVLTGAVPRLDPSTVYWQRVDGGPIPLAVTGTGVRPAGTADELADLLYDDVVVTAIGPVADVVQREFQLSPQVVWGNVASALGGASTMLAKARADVADRVAAIADGLLRRGSLAGTGHFVRRDGRPTSFRRHNCCLFYRIPGGGICADCVLGSDDDGVAASGSPATQQPVGHRREDEPER